MNNLQGMLEDLRQHQQLCLRILALVERENQALRETGKAPGPDIIRDKKDLLPELNSLLNRIRHHRAAWQKLGAADRARMTDVPGLLRQVQDLIMKIIVLDRENEQILLRNGLVPPRHLPSVNQQRPHFVADLYRRQGRS